jgi:hypothetical protein
MTNIFYKEHIDIDKTQEVPSAVIYAEYAGYMKYSLIWKFEDNVEVLAFLKNNKIRVSNVKERLVDEWSDRLKDVNHYELTITRNSFEKIRDSKILALEISYD